MGYGGVLPCPRPHACLDDVLCWIEKVKARVEVCFKASDYATDGRYRLPLLIALTDGCYRWPLQTAVIKPL